MEQMKQPKWQQEFEKWNSGSKDAELEILENKNESRTISKEEYKKLEQMKGIKANISKVSNILEMKEKLEEEKEKIKKELEYRKANEKSETEQAKEVEKLDKEMEELLVEDDKLTSELKSKDLSDEKRKELQTKKSENSTKRNENNSKMSKYIEQCRAGNGKLSGVEELANESTDKLEAKLFETDTKISKCNLAGKYLMQGKDWNTISIGLAKISGNRFTEKIDSEKSKEEEQKEEEQKEGTEKPELPEEKIDTIGKALGIDEAKIEEVKKGKSDEAKFKELYGKYKNDIPALKLAISTRMDEIEYLKADNKEPFQELEEMEAEQAELANRVKELESNKALIPAKTGLLGRISSFFSKTSSNIENFFTKRDLDKITDAIADLKKTNPELKELTDIRSELDMLNKVEELYTEEKSAEIQRNTEARINEMEQGKEFDEFLAQVADKGFDQVKKEEAEAKRKAAEEKLAENRERSILEREEKDNAFKNRYRVDPTELSPVEPVEVEEENIQEKEDEVR